MSNIAKQNGACSARCPDQSALATRAPINGEEIPPFFSPVEFKRKFSSKALGLDTYNVSKAVRSVNMSLIPFLSIVPSMFLNKSKIVRL